jgi:allantoinase
MSDAPGHGHSVRNRLDYLPIVDRPALRLPNDARVAVITFVNIENWRPEFPMPRTVLPPPMGQPLLPDVPNWSWHEYGMRVGFWRFLEALTSRDIPVTMPMNGSTVELYTRCCEAARDAGWEFMGHGYVQGPMHRLEDQRRAIADTVTAIRSFTGKAPRGWESPGLTETDETLDILREEGIEYVCNWPLDDLPARLRTRAGEMVSVPYPLDVNDVVMTAVQQQPSDEILRRGVAQFDRLYAEGAKAPRIFTISVHPYLTGVPHRIGPFEELLDYVKSHAGVEFMTGEQVLDWYVAQGSAAV